MDGLFRFVTLKGLTLATTAAIWLCFGQYVQAQFGILYLVDSTGDGDLVGPSTSCDDGTGHCTLRAAIEASNLHVGADTIAISIPTTDPGYSNGKWTINLPRALPNIVDSVNISGPGADRLIVRRNTGGSYSVLNITTTGTVSLTGITVDNGGFVVRGGGVDHENGGTLNISDCIFSHNGGDEGGAINNAGNLTVRNCLFTGNTSATGGAIDNVGAATVTNCTATGNSAGGFGGGAIYNTGTLTVSSSTIDANKAQGSSGDGGGVNSGGSLTVVNSTISDNSAVQEGGGIFYNGSGSATVSNCTVAGNSAASGGGVVSQGSGAFDVKSTIIASNTAFSVSNPQDVYGAFNSSGFNLIGKRDGSMGFTASTDLTGTMAAPLDPKLDPRGLQNNGGATDTIALLNGSPAIDKGTSNGLTGTLITDQRGVGYKRPINQSVPNAAGGDGADIGAFELGAHIKAVSRKAHGSVGNFDVNLPLFGPKVGVECRTGGSSRIFELIMTFPTAVTVGSIAVTPDPKATGATASVSSTGVSGTHVTVNLSGVSNAQKITLTLSGVSDGQNTNDVDVPMGVLLGDTNNNGSVASNDVTLTQSKVGQAVNGSNFREDVNHDGAINSNDVNLVKSKLGTKLP